MECKELIEMCKEPYSKRGATITYSSAQTADDAIGDMLDAELLEMGYSADDIEVFPCCKEVR